MTAKRDAINAALVLAEDVSAGKLDPAHLDRELQERCRELVGHVVGPDDALWELQCEIARGVLAAGGLDPNEVAEWGVVLARQRPQDGETLSAPSDHPSGDPSTRTEPLSPDGLEKS